MDRHHDQARLFRQLAARLVSAFDIRRIDRTDPLQLAGHGRWHAQESPG
jgi:hypothetical protein